MIDPLPELEKLTVRLERLQKALGLDDTTFVARYQRHLKSAKTWRQRLCARNYTDLDIEKRLKMLRELVAIIDGGTQELPSFFADMPFARTMAATVAMLEGQNTDRRNVYALATTGVGKSVFARKHVSDNPQTSTYVRMHQHCRNSEYYILDRLVAAMGLKPQQAVGASLRLIIAHLQANPLLIFIDEAHSGGHKLMQIVKSFIDETPARFVQLAYPTEFDRVRTATAGALDEAKQLIGRTIKPIFDDYRDGLKIPDVECYLTNSGLSADDARDITPRILPLIRQNGNLRVLADAMNDARMVAEEYNKPMDGLMIRQAVEAQCPVRKSNENK